MKLNTQMPSGKIGNMMELDVIDMLVYGRKITVITSDHHIHIIDLDGATDFKLKLIK